jgi:serine protease Do
MSNKMLRLMGRTICLTVFCLSLTLLAVAAGRTNITGTWELNHLQGDKPDQNAQEGAGSHADLTDFVADQVAEQHDQRGDQPSDQRETVTGMPNDRILLMMAGISSPPEKLTVALNDSAITFSDGKGASLTLHTDGRAEKFRDGIQIIARWVNDSLIIATVGPQANVKTTLARDGRQLCVVSEADFPGAGPVVTRYAYDYGSTDVIPSSAFWQLHPPVYHEDSKKFQKAIETSYVLLDQINREIARASVPGGDIVNSLHAFPSDHPAPPGPIKRSSFNNIAKRAPNYGTNPLRAFDSDLRALTDQVSPAVVQILVDRYGTGESEDSGQAALITKEKSVASGVILDPSGYIITNAHAIKGAWRIRVILTKPDGDSDELPPATEESVLPATIVGGTNYFDLALLKIDASNLPTLSFADFREVGQGQIVVAVGSPLGLNNSVTMGIISSVARQADPNSPLVYVQTDAPINPGNSGGALVDVNGRLIGINTSIFTHSGGSEGVGFALPATTVQMVYENLRTKGYVGRRSIGVGIQPITPVLAKGLKLRSTNGLVVCDVLPGTSAEKSGLKIGDVVVEADSRRIITPPEFDSSIYGHDLSKPLSLAVMRGTTQLMLQVKIVEEEDWIHSTIGPVDPAENSIQQLGVIAATLPPNLAGGTGGARFGSGVIVFGRTSNPAGLDLSPGDIIHSVNGQTVGNVKVLRELVAQFKPSDPVVLLIERQGGLGFISFEMD